MTQIAALSRYVQWLVNQDEIVQAWVFGLMSPDDLGGILMRKADGNGSEG
jgi:hypothetical protein